GRGGVPQAGARQLMAEEQAVLRNGTGRGRTRLAIAIAAVAVLVVALLAWRYYAVRESTDDAQIDGHIHGVAARVGGTILSVHVEDNSRVEAGALLAEIDPKDYQVALDRAQADLAEAAASAQAARTGVPVASATTSS